MISVHFQWKTIRISQIATLRPYSPGFASGTSTDLPEFYQPQTTVENSVPEECGIWMSILGLRATGCFLGDSSPTFNKPKMAT